jgi:hypothetical protein
MVRIFFRKIGFEPSFEKIFADPTKTFLSKTKNFPKITKPKVFADFRQKISDFFPKSVLKQVLNEFLV